MILLIILILGILFWVLPSIIAAIPELLRIVLRCIGVFAVMYAIAVVIFYVIN